MQSMKSIHHALLASSLLGVTHALAGSAAAPSDAVAATTPSTATGLLLGKFSGESAWDRAWSAFTLYKDDNNPILQEFSLQGRLQVQYADGHSDSGHFDIEDYKNAGKDEAVWGDKLEARRAYFGIKTKWFQNWKLEGQIDVDTDAIDGQGGHTLYKDIYDLYLTYVSSDALNISIGKQEIKLSREQEISSKEIVTIERSLVTNMLHPGNLTGLWVSGKGIQDHWLYEAGIYSNDQVREFSNFDGGLLVLTKAGYDYSSQAHLDSAIVSLRYMHNTDPGYKSTETEANSNYAAPTSPAFSDSICLSNDIIQGRFGLTTDIMYGFGYEGKAEQAGVNKDINQSDIFGISIIPSYFIADGLQLVGRVQWATSGDVNPKSGTTPATTNLALPGRYEKYAPNVVTNGDRYTSFYLGLNYYLYGNKLKIMNGIEYSMMDGGIANPAKNQTASYDGYTYYTGLRMSF